MSELHPERANEPGIAEGIPVEPSLPSQTHRRLSLSASHSQYVSELPSPDDIERYERIEEGVLRWLMDASTKEQDHRHEIERRLVALDESSMPHFYSGQAWGRGIALILGIGFEGVMAFAIHQGEVKWGVGGAAAGLAAMIWAVRRDPTSRSPDDDLDDG
ncbi:MAG: DUF2335 domain-containing protein [Patulibacter sp.]